MAATSAGSLQSDTVPSNVGTQQDLQQQHHPQFSQPSTSYQLQPPQQQQQPQFQPKQKIKYISRSSSGISLSSIIENSNSSSSSSSSSSTGSANNSNHSQSCIQSGDIGVRSGVVLHAPPKISARHPNLVKQQQHQQQHLQQLQKVVKPSKSNAGIFLQQPNIAPGWRRLIANDEVIYVSPSGASLRNLDQIKDYLLSTGTCKCGLPCPLRTETFFDFDSQVPTKSVLDNDIPRLPCSHQYQYLEQQTLAKRDVNRKKQPMEWTPPPSVSPASISESTSSTPPAQLMATGSSSRFQSMNPSLAGMENSVESVTQQYLQQPSTSGVTNVVYQSTSGESGNKPLSRTPPWRKNSSLNQPKSESPDRQPMLNSYAEDRVPPLPQQHFPQPQQPAPAQHLQQPQTSQWQETTTIGRQGQMTKVRLVSKKCPTFKEDPTGYLNQQTALLHNSISTLHSPNGSPSIEAANQKFTSQKPVLQHEPIFLPKAIKEEVTVAPKFFQQTTVISGRDQLPMPPSSALNNQIRQIIHNTEQNQLIINQRQQKVEQPSGYALPSKPPAPIQVQQQNCDNNNVSHLQMQQHLQLRRQIQQQRQLMRQTQQLQMVKSSSVETYLPPGFVESRHLSGKPASHVVMTTNSRESPVSSSTTFSRATPDRSSSSGTPDPKGPVQGGMISTSNNEPPGSTPSPAESPESSRSRTPSSSSTNFCAPKLLTSHGSHKNTITSVIAGKNSTSTTSVNQSMAIKSVLIDHDGDHIQMLDSQNTSIRIINQQTGTSNVILNTTNSALKNRNQIQMVQQCLPVSSNVSSMQQVMSNSTGNSQIIMTSTGQILVMSPQQHQPTQQQHQGKPQQILINQSPSGSRTVMMHSPQQGVVINQTNSGNGAQFMNGQLLQNVQQAQQQQTNNVVIQNSQMLQQGHNSSYLMNSPNMIINNSLIQQQNNQNQLMTTGNATKIISNNGNIITTNQTNMMATNQPTMMTTNNQIIHQQSGLGQQTMVLNTMPNGTMVLQPHFTTTIDGQQVMINQDNSTTTTYVQQQPGGHILISPDSKRRGKKRKGSGSSGSLTPQGLSPQQIQLSPTTIQQHGNSGQPPVSPGVGTMMHLTPQYQQQSFQLSPGLTLVQKQNPGQQQQILLQNGQTIIHQPLNLIGQQLLIPAGMMVAPDTTLVQIQNVAPCGSIITPQGMVLRTPSPQQKQFLSPNTGQQFIVNQNGQISPIGQIYNTQVGLVMPPQSSAAPTFVQQNTTIVQQQTTMMNSNNNTATTQSILNDLNAGHSVSTQTAQAQAHQHAGSASPPDTTTHSPRSPERPSSGRSGGSNDSMSMAMVHQVSSSEPDSVISPSGADSAQSPSNNDHSERDGGISYQQTTFKPTVAKMRRLQAAAQILNNTMIVDTYTNQMTANSMTPDSHDSPQSSSNSNSNSNSPITTTYYIGELVWGAVRGHPAWPGKVIQPPEGYTTPSDCAWVRWFGGRPNAEMVPTQTLKSLSDGLEAHHKAQKDTRKSRKLNSQLERAIQEAMAELDRAPNSSSTTSNPVTYLTTSPTSTTQKTGTPTTPKGRRQQSTTTAMITNVSPPTPTRQKPVKIAPAPPSGQQSSLYHSLESSK